MTTQIGILIIGNEILDGLVLDTNSQWLINQLKALSLQVFQKITVTPAVDLKRIEEVVVLVTNQPFVESHH